jgi:hypothetical protein
MIFIILKVILTGENTTNGKESKIITGSSIIFLPFYILIPDLKTTYFFMDIFENRCGPVE